MIDITDIFESNLHEATIDTNRRLLRGVVIMASNKSKNDRLYSQKAQENILALSNGVRSFLDHPDELKKANQVRSIRDFCGSFSNPKLEGTKLTADFRATTQHFPLFKDIAEMQAPLGFSLNLRGMASKGKDDIETIESVEKIHSIDAVSYPALTHGLFESHIKSIINSKMSDEEIQEEVRRVFGGEIMSEKSLKENLDEYLKGLER